MGTTSSGCGGRHSVDSAGGEGEPCSGRTVDGHDDDHVEDPFFDEELEYSPRLTRFESILDSRGYLNPSFFPHDWLGPVAEGDGGDGGGDGRDDYDDEGYDGFEALNGSPDDGGGGGDGDGVGSLDSEPPSGRRGRAESTRVLHKSIATLHAAEDAADSGAPPDSASASVSAPSPASSSSSSSSSVPVPLSSAALPGPGKLRPSEMKTVLRTKLTTTLATFWALFVGDDAADGMIRDHHHEISGNTEIEVGAWEKRGSSTGAGGGGRDEDKTGGVEAGGGGSSSIGSGGRECTMRMERVQNFRSPIKGALPDGGNQ